MKRLGGKINNWYKCACSEDGIDFVIKGNVTGDDKWDEGEFLTTSLVMHINQDQTEMKTLNTIYTLGDKHPEFEDRWNRSKQALVDWMELDIPEFYINPEYYTDIPVGFKYKKHRQVNTSVEEAPWCGSYGTVDHPAFAALRKHLKACGLIYMEESWINGDRVLKPFKLNDILFNEGQQFVCAAAMKHHLEVETEEDV